MTTTPPDARGECVLAACPFCGGEGDQLLRAFTEATSDFAFWSVECRECGVAVADDESQAAADAAWNRRPAPPAPVDRDGFRAGVEAAAKVADDFARQNVENGFSLDGEEAHVIAIRIRALPDRVTAPQINADQAIAIAIARQMDADDGGYPDPVAPSGERERVRMAQAIGAEIDRQCKIGAGTAGTADDGSGLFEVHADLDLNGFADAIPAITRPSAASEVEVVPEMDIGATNRGFAIARGKDRYGEGFSVQDSSLADETCVWLGGDGSTGRAHLTQDQVAALLPLLHRFVETGSIAALSGHTDEGK